MTSVPKDSLTPLPPDFRVLRPISVDVILCVPVADGQSALVTVNFRVTRLHPTTILPHLIISTHNTSNISLKLYFIVTVMMSVCENPKIFATCVKYVNLFFFFFYDKGSKGSGFYFLVKLRQKKFKIKLKDNF